MMLGIMVKKDSEDLQFSFQILVQPFLLFVGPGCECGRNKDFPSPTGKSLETHATGAGRDRVTQQNCVIGSISKASAPST